MNLKLSVLPITVLLFAATTGSGALPDARQVLQELTHRGEEPAEVETPDAGEMNARLAGLPPEESAAAWLGWVDDFLASGGDDLFLGGRDRGFTRFLNALPPPAAWPALRAAIQSGADRRDPLQQKNLELLAAILANDSAAQWDLLFKIEDRAHAQADAGSAIRSEIHRRQAALRAAEELGNTFLEQFADEPDRVTGILERRLERPAEERFMGRRLRVPDLAAVLGEEEAVFWLRRLLLDSTDELDFGDASGETADLARKVAMEEIESLRSAPWRLVRDFAHLDLYRALADRFPAGPEDRRDFQRRQAERVWFLHLIDEGDFGQAREMYEQSASGADLVRLPYQLARQLDRERRGELLAFLEETLERNPDLPLWETYFMTAERYPDWERPAGFLETMLQSREWEPAQRLLLRKNLARMLLAADQVDESISMIREDLVWLQKEERPDRETRDIGVRMGIRMAIVGLAVDEDELFREGFALVQKMPGQARADYRLFGLFNILLEAGRLEEAHALAVDRLRAGVQRMEEMPAHSPDARSELMNLARVYHLAGRHDEVMVLLEEAPWWGAADLAEFPERGNRDLPFFHVAAAALVHRGRSEEAAALLRDLLLGDGGFDPAFELLLEIDEAGAVEWFERLFELDPFQERPLIWKARALRANGRAEEARVFIEKAIAIDPSDGEQGPGNRMRAYETMAEILEDLGETEKAAFYRDVVSAIRLSEKADRIYEAGLRSRSIALHREALDFFADAYCIQARLALQLQEAGRHEEAEEHYRRAYELMPDSFGRVESHCFGCEGVFGDERAQTTAERVFARMREERTDQPQVWYLSGYLEQTRGRHREALSHFQRAVELDPDYLNAWKQISTLGHRPGEADREWIDRAVVAMLRLDPLGRHTRPRADRVLDLRSLWMALEEAAARQPLREERLFPLPASARETARAGEMDGMISVHGPDEFAVRGKPDSPSRIIARHSLLRGIAESLDATVR